MTPRRPNLGPWGPRPSEEAQGASRGPWRSRPSEEAQKAPRIQLPSDRLSREGAAILNQRNIALSAAWLFADKDIERIFELKRAQFDTQQRFEREVQNWKNKMNRDMVRITMSLLCQDWLERRSEPPGVPVNKLKEYLVAHVSGEAKYKRVERALKTLRRAGFVEGYERRDTHTTKQHEVRATKKGVDEHLKYLARCSDECQAFDRDLSMMRLDEELKQTAKKLGLSPEEQ